MRKLPVCVCRSLDIRFRKYCEDKELFSSLHCNYYYYYYLSPFCSSSITIKMMKNSKDLEKPVLVDAAEQKTVCLLSQTPL